MELGLEVAQTRLDDRSELPYSQYRIIINILFSFQVEEDSRESMLHRDLRLQKGKLQPVRDHVLPR